MKRKRKITDIGLVQKVLKDDLGDLGFEMDSNTVLQVRQEISEHDVWAKNPGWLITHPKLTVNQKFLVAYLKYKCGQKGTCKVAEPTIKKESGLSVSTIKRSIKRLENFGYVTVKRQKKQNSKENEANTYQLHWRQIEYDFKDSLGDEGCGFAVTLPSVHDTPGEFTVTPPSVHCEPTVSPQRPVGGFAESQKLDNKELEYRKPNVCVTREDSAVPKSSTTASTHNGGIVKLSIPEEQLKEKQTQDFVTYARERSFARFLSWVKDTFVDITGCTPPADYEHILKPYFDSLGLKRCKASIVRIATDQQDTYPGKHLRMETFKELCRQKMVATNDDYKADIGDEATNHFDSHVGDPFLFMLDIRRHGLGVALDYFTDALEMDEEQARGCVSAFICMGLEMNDHDSEGRNRLADELLRCNTEWKQVPVEEIQALLAPAFNYVATLPAAAEPRTLGQ